MSTRSQALIKDTGVYLYQHHDGLNLFSIVQKAIAKKMRWDDVEYLTRIIFSEMIKDSLMDETGFGIGKERHGDIEYLVIVDVNKQTITENELYKKKETTISFSDC